MKKLKFEGKLNLNKEVASRLNDDQMNSAYGGAKATKIKKCGVLTNKTCPTNKLCETHSADTFCTITVPCATVDLTV